MMEEKKYLELLKNGDPEGLNALFKAYFRLVCTVSFRMINDQQTAEDIGQEVFMELWKKRDRISITGSIKSYLVRAASNKTLNFIRDQKIKLSNAEEPTVEDFGGTTDTEFEGTEELKEKISEAIKELPDRCRLVFLLSRDQEMSYREIAESLDISIKTVENQISKALKILRTRLAPYVAKMLVYGVLWTMA